MYFRDYDIKNIFRAQGWSWLISLTERITIGRSLSLTVGDLLLKLINISSQIYEPLLQLVSERVPESVLGSTLYRHPHSLPAAHALLQTGQFSPCEECCLTSCPVNILYARLFCSVYFFVVRLSDLTGEKFGVNSVSMI